MDLRWIEHRSGVSRHAGLHTVETNLGPIPEDDCVSGVNVVPQAINPAPPRPVVSGGLNTTSERHDLNVRLPESKSGGLPDCPTLRKARYPSRTGGLSLEVRGPMKPQPRSLYCS